MTIRIKNVFASNQLSKLQKETACCRTDCYGAYFEIAFDSEHPLHSGSLNGFSFKFNFANVLEHAL